VHVAPMRNLPEHNICAHLAVESICVNSGEM